MSYGLEALLKQRTEIDAELRKHKSPLTVMFTDLAGSTSYFDRFGDTAGVKWIEEHNRIVIPQVQQHAGTVVKTIGDSVMAYFQDPLSAVQAGLEIQRALRASNHGKPQADWMFVRVALHQGLGYLRGGDVFGDVVNVTARIAKVCLPAQILVSEAVYLSVHSAVEQEFRPAGEMLFHGKSSKEAVYELLWTDEATYTQLREMFPPPKKASAQETLTEGRYQILGELGRGAMGVVYKAYDRVIGRAVALKTIPVEVAEEEKTALVERLKVESRAAGMLDHPNIITIYDVGEEGGLFYFTMQYVDGKTLAQVCAERELIPLARVLEMMIQLCDAVGFAHQSGVIHRDLKPSNLVLTRQGAVKILDFGIAKLGDAGLTKAGVVMGTPSYLAPEQAAGRRIDARADIFSMGAILYELLTGERAFPGETTSTVLYKILHDDPIPPRVIEPSLPPALDLIVRKALAKDPLERFQTCEELAEALRQVGAGQSPNITAPASRREAAPAAGSSSEMTLPIAAAAEAPQRPRGRAALLVGALALAALLGGGGAWMALKNPPEPALPATSQTPAPAVVPEKQMSAAPVPAEQPPSTAPEDTAKTEAVPPSEPRKEKPRAAPPELTTGPPAANPSSGRGSSLFSAADVPGLLARADSMAARGAYNEAISLYQEIIKVDPKNQSAREGLARAKEARNMQR